MKFIVIVSVVFISSCVSASSKNIEYDVIINGNNECMYDYGEEDFCSHENQIYYQNVDKTANFDNDKVLIQPSNNFGYIIILDPKEKKAYPLNYHVHYDIFDSDKSSNKFCLGGTMSAYRDERSGYFCFKLESQMIEEVYE